VVCECQGHGYERNQFTVMDTFMNNVGRGITPTIFLMNQRIYKGSPLYKQWYGRYALDGKFWRKLKLAIYNG